MGIDYNRIKVADLEKNEPNKILTTNGDGELKFSNINDIKVDSYNALDYSLAGKPLDARQGKVLKDLIDNINTVLASDNVTLNTLQKLTDAIEVVQNSLVTLDSKQDIANQVEVSVSQNAQSSWHGKTVFFKTNVTITIPASGLPSGYTFEGATLPGCTLTWAIATPKVWALGTPPAIAEKSIFTLMQQMSNSNNIYLFGV